MDSGPWPESFKMFASSKAKRKFRGWVAVRVRTTSRASAYRSSRRKKSVRMIFASTLVSPSASPASLSSLRPCCLLPPNPAMCASIRMIEEGVVGIKAGVQCPDAVQLPEHYRRKQMVNRRGIVGMGSQGFFEVLGGAVIVGVVVMLK